MHWKTGAPDREFALQRYRACAAGYDASARRIAKKRMRAIQLLQLRPGNTVLDVACGTGPVLDVLSAAVGPSGRVIGVEQSPEMLDIARQRVTELQLGNVTLVEAAVEDARIGGPADAVLFCYTHDVLRSRRSLQNVFSAVCPGARIAVVGAKLFPRWLAPLNLWVKWRAWGYLSTVEGLDRPWSLLAEFCPDFSVREVTFLGSGYIGDGTYRN